MRVPSLVPVRCHFCSRMRQEWRIHRLAGNAQLICDYCLEWHNNALEFLAGNYKPGCQCCGATWEFLHDSTVGVEIRMYVVPKDGIYQILCAACIKPYMSKRADLYSGTVFGAEVLKV